MSLCISLASIQMAMSNNFELSIILMSVASIIDTLDGKIARYLKVDNQLGAILDSLSDLISFGVVPTIIIYLKIFKNHYLGCSFCILFMICITHCHILGLGQSVVKP